MKDNRELRIGNYVNYNDGSGHDDIRQVVGIDRNSVTSIVIFILIKFLDLLK